MRARKLLIGIGIGIVAGFALALGTPSVAQDEGGGVAAPAEDPKVVEAKTTVEAMRKEIERLSPRRFTKSVNVEWQTAEQFKAHMAKQMDEMLKPGMEQSYTDMLVALRFLPEGTNLRAMLFETMASQALAHYVPEADTFYVLKELPPDMKNGTYLHELQHAMQDQVLGLDVLQEIMKAHPDQSDRSGAMRFVFEGEATLLEQLYTVKAQMGVNMMDMADMIEPNLKMAAQMSFTDRMAQQQAAAAGMQGDLKASVEAQAKLPRYLLQSLQDAYIGGLWLTWRAWRVGGWEGIDQLFSEPPTSTEQVLHPDTKLLGDTREEPVTVTLPDLSALLGESRPLGVQDTMGEHTIQILGESQLPAAERATALAAAAGWGGDRLAMYGAPQGGKPVLAWLTVWDTAADATEFAAIYPRCAAANAERGWPAAVVVHNGLAVAVVEGLDAELGAKVAAALIAAAPAPPASTEDK